MNDLAASFKPHPKAAPKPRKQPRRTNLETSAAWYMNVIHKRDAALWTAEDYPAVVGTEPLQLQAHHIVPRQQCRKHGAPEWDTRNGMPVTKRRHERHHSRVEPIHRTELPDEVFLFLADYPALQPWFDRTYPSAPQSGAKETSLPVADVTLHTPQGRAGIARPAKTAETRGGRRR